MRVGQRWLVPHALFDEPPEAVALFLW